MTTISGVEAVALVLSEGDDDGDAAAARTPTARGAPPSRERRAAARLVREVCVVFAARTHSTVSLLTHVAGRGGARRQSSSSSSSSPANAGASGVSHHQDGGEIEKRTRVFRISWHLGLTLHPAARITAIGSACVRIVVALRRDWPIGRLLARFDSRRRSESIRRRSTDNITAIVVFL
jgi:hypothetical protein